ncbi:MAG: hypothetical protein R3Y04_08745 [Rikenellaceae bacterium]
MNNKLFSSYNRVKYLMRVKHWHGRSVHSPFLYSVVRESFMENDTLKIEEKLYNELIDNGFTKAHSQRVCRLYAYLDYKSYTFDANSYNNEDLIIVSEEIDVHDISAISEKAHKDKRTICVVVKSIYKTTKRYKTWNLLSLATGGVAVDMYHTGYLFLDYYLNKQKFKMRF